MKNVFTLIILMSILGSCSNRQILVVTTTEAKPWQIMREESIGRIDVVSQIVIDTNDTLQTIEGFGACFNELGWVALNSLSDEDKADIMSEFFEPGKGGNFSLCRMPVGANDFSRDWYSYNEQSDDFAMTNFSIANDLETLVPFIHLAQCYNPDLKLWASPWSPPSWMKWNKHYACQSTNVSVPQEYRNNLPTDRQGREGTNMFIQDSVYFKAYALYFSKFIEAYKKQGIEISMVMPQNEWNSCQVFPSCTWTASGLAEFIGQYLGSAMDSMNVDVMLGTMERPSVALVDTVLNDRQAAQYIKGVGFQWAGKDAIAGVHEKYPNITLYQTEQECGDGKNDWNHCIHAWNLMKYYIRHGASAYMYWNMVLNEGGVSRWGWRQNSLVSVDTENLSYKYNYEYFVLKHLSHFVKTGAKLLKVSGDADEVLSFLNPDGRVVLVLFNGQLNEKNVQISVNDNMYSFKVQGKSFNTIVL